MVLHECCHNLEIKNPRTMTRIDINAKNKFQIFFMTLGCLIRRFQQFYYLVICIDVSHLKGKYLESLFIVVVKTIIIKFIHWLLVLATRKEWICGPFS